MLYTDMYNGQWSDVSSYPDCGIWGCFCVVGLIYILNSILQPDISDVLHHRSALNTYFVSTCWYPDGSLVSFFFFFFFKVFFYQ